MGLLGSCWFLVECIIIPNGYIKLFFLSFYIHPFFLFFFQIFLWLEELYKCLLFIFLLLSRISCFPAFCIFKFIKRAVLFFLPRLRIPEQIGVFYDAMEKEEEEEGITQVPDQNQELAVFSCSIRGPTCIQSHKFTNTNGNVHKFQPQVFEVGRIQELCSKTSLENFYRDGFLDELDMDFDQLGNLDTSSSPDSLDLNLRAISFHQGSEDTDQINSPSTKFPDELTLEGRFSITDSTNSSTADLTIDDNVSSFPSSTLPIVELEQHLSNTNVDEEIDSFYHMYTERMRWFDILYRDRLFGMNALVQSSWNKSDRKMLARSLESDFELIYVSQMCMSWEALHYQYRKTESMIISSQNEALLHNFTARDFQKFQVLLERFMEDENCFDGERYSYFIHKRFSFKGLLQVPEVIKENGKIRGEPVRAIEVLEAIETCVKVFWLFVKSDKKPSWKFKSIFMLRTSPVEDPRDLELFYNVAKLIQKKGLLLKDFQGKKRCWLKRKVNQTREVFEKIDILFTMIDMKLVERVLKMMTISKSHLEWCQSKLNNLEFKDGKVFRACTSHLFPIS